MRYLLLDNIRSMNNVGAMFRNSDGAGYDKIILTGCTPTPPRNDISKTAIWAQDYIDWEYYENPLEVIKLLREDWFKIVAVELTDESVNYKELSKIKDENVCLIMGNEIMWVNEEILKEADMAVVIPMLWKKASLNVSVAAGIVMYELV